MFITWLFPFALLALGESSVVSAQSPDPAAARVEELVKQLTSARFEDRQAAQRALVELGEPAILPLRDLAAKHSDAEIRRQAKMALDEIESALLRQAREVIEKLGGSVSG